MLKAVIFDFNGVLMDDTFYIVKLYQETAKEHGLRVPTREEVISGLGLVAEEMAKKLLGDYEKCKPTLERIWKKYENEMKPIPSIREILAGLDMKKAIVTSSRALWLKDVLGDLINYFDVIITSESTEKHKPNPEPLFLACKKLEIKPNEAVYVGDRLIDFETAKNAGTDFIGILSGGTSKEEFKKAGVKKIINSLSELLNII